ncbi:hypothetical protein ACTXT7_002077 [Hymenolepis weldensis]
MTHERAHKSAPCLRPPPPPTFPQSQSAPLIGGGRKEESTQSRFYLIPPPLPSFPCMWKKAAGVGKIMALRSLWSDDSLPLSTLQRIITEVLSQIGVKTVENCCAKLNATSPITEYQKI